MRRFHKFVRVYYKEKNKLDLRKFRFNIGLVSGTEIVLLLKLLLLFFHSPGQSSVLHEVEEEDDPEQSVPPFSGPSFDLVRVMVPEPHDLEHAL